MKPRELVAESTTPDGLRMGLYTHDGDWSISLQGQELMHSKASASELFLGELGVERLGDVSGGRVLIGGLGLGFTLKSVLEGLGPDGQVDVVELLPEIIAWNREQMRDLNGALLDDPRVNVVQGDAVEWISQQDAAFYDSISLDIDNGPTAMVQASNRSLYSDEGLRSVRRLLRPEGRVAFWSAGVCDAFQKRMEKARFRVSCLPAKVHERAKRAAYRIYLGELVGPS